MKKLLLPIFIFFLTIPASLYAEDFLGAPLIPGGKTVERTKSRLEMKSPLSHDEIVAFYRQALKKYEDIKFRDWKDATYIEDDGRLALYHHLKTVQRRDQPGHRERQLDLDHWNACVEIYRRLCGASFPYAGNVHLGDYHIEIGQKAGGQEILGPDTSLQQKKPFLSSGKGFLLF